jgi:glycerol-3-phosphate dehydrogenase (NAD(P)+)
VFEKVAVVGAGSWGTTVASIAARGARTVVWARRPALAAAIAESHQNPDYLPDVVLPDGLSATDSLAEAVREAQLVVMAVPSHGFRSVLEALAPHLSPGAAVLSLVKGLERETQLRMTEIVREVLPGNCTGVLSGPNLAREIVAGQPAATVVAMTDNAIAECVQQLLGVENLRVYTSPDVVGCEMAGATKNVLAIGAGISDGLGLGDSSRAALITRGLAELGRLVVAAGGRRLTIAGLAGVGDLVATCTSPLSRNRSVGVELGRGRSLEDVVGDMRMVAEGVKSAGPLLELSGTLGVEMPIAEQVAGVLRGEQEPSAMVSALMRRTAKPEFEPAPATGEWSQS